MVECVYDETKIAIGIEWLSFNRCVTITNISTLITHRLEFAIRISVFSIKYPPSAVPSTIHCHLSMLLPMLPLIPNRKSTTCDYRFCAYVHTYSRILTIFIYTQTFWLSIEFLGAFLPSLGLLLCILFSLSLSIPWLHLLLEIFLLNYPKVSVENEIYWILFDWSNSNSLQNISNINGYFAFQWNVI